MSDARSMKRSPGLRPAWINVNDDGSFYEYVEKGMNKNTWLRIFVRSSRNFVVYVSINGSSAVRADNDASFFVSRRFSKTWPLKTVKREALRIYRILRAAEKRVKAWPT